MMPPTAKQHAWFFLLVVSVAVFLAGCGPDSAPRPTGNDVFALAYDEAKDADASPSQLDALAKASNEGEMGYEELASLIHDTFNCLDDAGIPYQPIYPWERWPGFAIPMYGIGESEILGGTSSTAIAAECELKYSGFAFMAYQNQPSAQDARDERFREDLPATLACLVENGYTLPEDASLDEVRAAVSELAIETGQSGELILCSEWAY